MRRLSADRSDGQRRRPCPPVATRTRASRIASRSCVEALARHGAGRDAPIEAESVRQHAGTCPIALGETRQSFVGADGSRLAAAPSRSAAGSRRGTTPARRKPRLARRSIAGPRVPIASAGVSQLDAGRVDKLAAQLRPSRRPPSDSRGSCPARPTPTPTRRSGRCTDCFCRHSASRPGPPPATRRLVAALAELCVDRRDGPRGSAEPRGDLVGRDELDVFLDEVEPGLQICQQIEQRVAQRRQGPRQAAGQVARAPLAVRRARGLRSRPARLRPGSNPGGPPKRPAA